MEQLESHLPQERDQNERKPRRARGLALTLAGALLGSILGGGAVMLYVSGMPDENVALNASQQEYIDQAVEKAAENIDLKYSALPTPGTGSDTAETVQNESNLVTTDYSETVQNVVSAVSDSVVGVATDQGTGSGVIVSSNGLILTNEHVIAANSTTQMFRPGYDAQQTAPAILVTLADGTEYPAEVLYSDAEMDLAVIKINATGLTAARLGNSDAVSVGEIAIAIGNPLGLDQTVTSGIISALGVSAVISTTQIAENLIQTDAAINSGNSGGALLNAAGEVIGINSYKLSSGEGIGFAISINAAKPIIDQIVETGEFQQAVLGASLIDSELLSYVNYDITLDRGLYVYAVEASSDASAQGLQPGDVITAIDGVNVNTIIGMKEQLYQHIPGESVTLTVERESQTIQITVKLGAKE